MIIPNLSHSFPWLGTEKDRVQGEGLANQATQDDEGSFCPPI